jgi:hypothetical protein
MTRLRLGFFFGICSGALALACASVPKLPPKASPDEVEVFFPGTMPTEEFKALATLRESADLGVSDEVLIARLRRRAAELGADALLIRTIRRTAEGEVGVDLNRPDEKIVEAVAVYYPARRTSQGT